MKKYLENITKSKENIIFNNASKDFIEFLLYQISSELKQPLVFINQGFSLSRIQKNFNFLNPSLKLEYLAEDDEIYSLKSQSLLSLSRQNKVIKNIIDAKFDILFLDYKLLLRKLPSINFFKETLILESGKSIGYSHLLTKLLEYGFFRCETVFDFGEFAVRGFVIDIATLNGYIRLEFDGDKICSICTFNPETQRKNPEGNLQSVEIYKIKHAVLSQNWEETVKQNASKKQLTNISKIIEDINNFGNLNLSAFLPLFHNNMESILNFLPQNIQFIKWSNLDETLNFFISNLEDLHRVYSKNNKTFLSVNDLFFNKNSILSKIKGEIEITSFL